MNKKVINPEYADSTLHYLVPNKILTQAKFCTSTPKTRIMEAACSKFSKVCLIQDNDSGYQDNSNSTLESSNDGYVITNTSKPIYLSEDALLEKPEVVFTKSDAMKSPKLDRSSSFVLESSIKSMSTDFSGLQDSNSDTSDIIDIVPPINCSSYSNVTFPNGSNSERGNLKCLLEKSKHTSSSEISEVIPITPTKTMKKSSFYYNNSISDIEDNLVRTPSNYKNLVNPDLSPDLFSDEESEQLTEQVKLLEYKEKYVLKGDQLLIQHAQNALNGLLPPPSLRVASFTVSEMLDKINKHKDLFCDVTEIKERNKTENCNLLVTTTFEHINKLGWPQILEERYYGLHHNRSKLSEDFEQLCTKYASRYVGAETQTSCTVFDSNNQISPSKRKATKLRWGGKSPGRRLSHLARRRITFSSASLQQSNSRQVLVDAKRIELLACRKSPRKKSPRKTPKKRVKTPSSSSKKRATSRLRLFIDDDDNNKAGPSSMVSTVRADASRRALFQSPEQNKYTSSAKRYLFPGALTISPCKRKKTPKRALFTSPTKHSPLKRCSQETNKRKRAENDDVHPAKFARSLSIAEEDSNSKPSNLLKLKNNITMNNSQGYIGELSAHHKKKLQWAVYEALRSQKINITHPQFKVFASILARVTRRFLPNLSGNAPRPEGGTSERMLRIARQHVFAVTRGKTVDEIIQSVQESRAKIPVKPTGYVGPNSCSLLDNTCSTRNKENVFHDSANIMPRKQENKIDRVRKVINFDDNESSR